jgi:hypothetical protein
MVDVGDAQQAIEQDQRKTCHGCGMFANEMAVSPNEPPGNQRASNDDNHHKSFLNNPSVVVPTFRCGQASRDVD